MQTKKAVKNKILRYAGIFSGLLLLLFTMASIYLKIYFYDYKDFLQYISQYSLGRFFFSVPVSCYFFILAIDIYILKIFFLKDHITKKVIRIFLNSFLGLILCLVILIEALKLFTYIVVECPRNEYVSRTMLVEDYLYFIYPGMDIKEVKSLIPKDFSDSECRSSIGITPVTMWLSTEKSYRYELNYSRHVLHSSGGSLCFYFNEKGKIIGFYYLGLIKFDKIKYLKILERRKQKYDISIKQLKILNGII